jgi:hypothetical protein
MSKKNNENTVPWNFETPIGMRDAIVRAYVPHMAEGSDQRYKNEYASISAPPYVTELEDREALVKVLESNGVKVSKLESAGEFNGQGEGYYSVLTLEQIEEYYTTTLFISNLGRFVARDMVWFQQDHSYNMIDDELGFESKKRISLCQQIVTQSGFSWPKEELLKSIVPNLNVYYFGSREPLPICDLLYYWQD